MDLMTCRFLSRVSKCGNRGVPESWRKRSAGVSEARRLVRHGSVPDHLNLQWVNPTIRTQTPVLSLR